MLGDHSKQSAERSCAHRDFRSLFTAQGLGALNDNFIKTVISLLIVSEVSDESLRPTLLALGTALFVLPYVAFSSYAGFLADRFRKSQVMKWTKGVEILIALLFFVLLAERNVPLLLAALFLMGLHSAVFSPSKFGVLPEILDGQHLSKGNGYIEFGTFVAIIAGTALGGLFKSLSDSGHSLAGGTVIVIALCGFASMLFLGPTPVANPSRPFPWNPFKDLFETLRDIRKVRPLFLTLLAISYFWFLGALFQIAILLYAKDQLRASDVETSILLAALAIGTGLGSIFAGKISEGKIETGLVPIGAAGMSLFFSALYFSSNSFVLSLVVVVLLGLSCGCYVVPLNAFMQRESPVETRGRYLGALNTVSFTAMLLASGVFSVLAHRDVANLSPSTIFLLFGILTAGVGWYVTKTIPGMLIRCVNWIASHLLYSLRVVGKENVPAHGGALLVCNHLSFADPALILAALDRPVRFLMYKPIYDHPLVHPIAKTLGAIPIAPELGPKRLIQSLQVARDAVENGELVCIFAEGAITRLGRLLPFSKGLERIVQGLNVPIIPVHLDELWGSIFSFRGGRFFWKLPKEMPYPVTLLFGAPLSSDSKTHVVRQATQELSADSFRFRHRRHQLLHVGFLNVAKRHPFRRCVSDSSGARLRYGELLAGALLLSRLLRRGAHANEKIGVLLPASCAGVTANVASLIAGLVPVNLNFTASSEALESACRACDMRRVVTSKAFLEKVDVKLPAEFVFLEELLPQIGRGSKLLWSFLSIVLPPFVIERLFFSRGLTRHDLATVMFSSGSTGEPKGVMLSHENVASNVESIYDVYQLNRDDCLIGVLPLFHSFGFTGTMWLPLLGGIRAVYHPNPVEGGVIGEMCRDHRGTILMSTPTFLLNYIRKVPAEHFATLRHVIVGAEKLKQRVADAFVEKFGVVPREGYGCTELSPVAMVNVPDFEGEHVQQKGSKPGTVGHPVPGVAARIVGVDDGALLSPGEPGLLLIKGPNVMLGYLKNEEKTREVIRDGWYVTGDIAVIDEEGFVSITDRLSRFSKIGVKWYPI